MAAPFLRFVTPCLHIGTGPVTLCTTEHGRMEAEKEVTVMKRTVLPALLLALALCGCAAQTLAETQTTPPPKESAPAAEYDFTIYCRYRRRASILSTTRRVMR